MRSFVVVFLQMSPILTAMNKHHYTKLVIPNDYYQSLTDQALISNGNQGLDLDQCVLLCTLRSSCHAVKNDAVFGCDLLQLAVPAGKQPKFVTDKMADADVSQVYAKREFATRRAGFIENLVSLANSKVAQARLNVMPVVTGDLPSLSGTEPFAQYQLSLSTNSPTPALSFPLGKDGIVTCVAVLNIAMEIPLPQCKQWSFQTDTWSILPGQMSFGRVDGGGAFLAGKIWLFHGDKTEDGQDIADCVKAESYTLGSASWEELKDVPYGAVKSAVLAISDTEILIAQGQPKLEQDATTKWVVYDITTDDYPYSGDMVNEGGANRGVADMGCAMAPDGLGKIALCAGGVFWPGGDKSKRVHRFDVANHLWLTPRDSDDVMGNGGVTRFAVVHAGMAGLVDKLYMVENPDVVYEVDYDEEADGPVVMTEMAGLASNIKGRQILFPVFYDEITI